MIADRDHGSGFDRLLEAELQNRLGGVEGPSPEVRQSAYQAFWSRRRSGARHSGIRSIFSRTLVLSLAAGGVLIASGSLAVAAGAGSAGPNVWGRVITTALQECSGQLAGGQQGVGECLHAVATQRGERQPAGDRSGTSGGGKSNDRGGAVSPEPVAAGVQAAQREDAGNGRGQGENQGQDLNQGQGEKQGQGEAQNQGQAAAQSKTPPGQSKTPPGQSKSPPGQSKSQQSSGQQQNQGKSESRKGGGKGKSGGGGGGSSHGQGAGPSASPPPSQ
jgi:hypothetical protein